MREKLRPRSQMALFQEHPANCRVISRAGLVAAYPSLNRRSIVPCGAGSLRNHLVGDLDPVALALFLVSSQRCPALYSSHAKINRLHLGRFLGDFRTVVRVATPDMGISTEGLILEQVVSRILLSVVVQLLQSGSEAARAFNRSE